MNISALPRFPLATLPTPLDELPRLSEELGVRVLMKRDDLTGFALGGNKARKLEFIVADALAKHADVLVTSGGVQSNHTRMTAAAARKVGMDATLVLFGSPPPRVNGNLLLEEILAVDIVYSGSMDRNETERVAARVSEELRAKGRRPYHIPAGGYSVLGCIAYILAVGELLEQLKAQSIKSDALVITTGSCGTHAGILAGVKFFAERFGTGNLPVHGITVSRSIEEGRARITQLVKETAQFIERDLTLRATEIIIHDDYLGPGYASITPEARMAIQRVARLEGIFLDPVYTGKAMAGLMDLAQRGVFKQGSTVVFWHTGGTPGIFGYPEQVIPENHN